MCFIKSGVILKIFLPALFFTAVNVSLSYAFVASSANYRIIWEGDDSGRSQAENSPSFRFKGAIGALTGQMSTSGFRYFAGYYMTIESDCTMPSAVNDLTADPAGDGNINLEWSDSSDEESFITGYRVYRSLVNGNFNDPPVAETSVSNYSDNAGLIYGLVYYYCVRAVDAGSNEQFLGNNSASALSKSLSTSVIDLSAVSMSGGAIHLDWSPVTGAAEYNIYRSIVCGDKGNCVNSSKVLKPGYDDNLSQGLSNGTRYYYLVQIKDNSGNEQIKGNIQVSALCDSLPPNCPVPDSPTHPADRPAFSNMPEFCWLESVDQFFAPDGGSGVKGYYFRLDRLESSDFDFQSGQFTDKNTTTLGPVDDGEWWFHIFAVDFAGNKSPQGKLRIIVKTSGTINGKIDFQAHYDASKNCKVELVLFQSAIKATSSDSCGNYSFNNVDFGRYKVKFTPKGYCPYTSSEFEITKDNTPLVLYHNPPGKPIISTDEAASYPNPASGSKLTFVFWSSRQQQAKVKIYNLNAELVGELTEYVSGPAFQEITWNIANIGAGIYFYRVSLIPCDDKQVDYPVKKLAVIKR